MNYFGKLFIGYDEIQCTFQNDKTNDIIFVIHRSEVGAKKYILNYLDSKAHELNSYGPIWFEGCKETWPNLRNKIVSRLIHF